MKTSLGFGILLLATLPSPFNNLFAQQCTSQAIAIGYRTIDFDGSELNKSGTEEKPESKLWWNDGFWWGMLWDPSRNAYSIHQFDPDNQCWARVGPDLDQRPKSSSDVLWDEAAQKLYASSRARENNRGDNNSYFFRFSYDSGSKTYDYDDGFPVVIQEKRVEALVIAKDSAGKIWATWEDDKKIMMNRTLGNDSEWGTPFQLPAAGRDVQKDDIATITAFDGNKIGVLWSNQKDKKIYFAVHRDGRPDNEWEPTEEALADKKLGKVADDHLNIAVHDNGTVLAATKTSLNPEHEPKIYLLKRDPSGDWSRHVFALGFENHTRPLVLVNSDNDSVYVVAKAKTNPIKIFIKSTHLSNPNFSEGLGETFIFSQKDKDINDPTSTKQSLNSESGLLVIASDKKSKQYFHNYFGPKVARPIITSVSPSAGLVGSEVTISGSDFVNVVEVKIGGVAASFIIESSSEIRATVPSEAQDGHIELRNHRGTSANSDAFVLKMLPIVSSFTPNKGSAGDEITISGDHFVEIANVEFNGTAAPKFTVDSRNQLRAEVPSGATSGKITVINDHGDDEGDEDFEIVMPPTIASFEPESGKPGTEITIVGSNFDGASEVSLGGVTALDLSIDSDARLRVTVPDDANSGKIRVQSLVGTGESQTNFVVIRPPTIISFSPTSGGRGSEISVTGNNLASVTEVALGGTPVTFTIDSDTELSFKVPSSAGTGKISVSNAAGAAESQRDFTLIESPIIQTFNPQEGIEGTEVTIAGAHLINVAEVTFNGTPATELIVDSDNQLRAQVPPGASSGRIAVTTAGGTIASQDDFEVLAAPVVDSFTPIRGLPGDEVTLHGSGFARVDRVAFGTTEASQFVIDSDQRLRATVPPSAENGTIHVVGQYGSAESHEPFQMLEAPAIAAFKPQSGPWGSEVTITGLNFVDIVSVTHNGLSVASFTVDSDSQIRAVVPTGSADGPFLLANRAGTAISVDIFAITAPQSVFTFRPTDDSFVHSGKAGKNYGDGTELRVREASESQYTYLKFDVSGLSGPMISANLRLYVLQGSDDAGDLHLVSNNYDDGKTPWKETGLDWKNAPAISGKPVKSLGAVKTGKTVNLKVTSVISGNGTYSFGIKNTSSQVAKFHSKEGGQAAELIVEVDVPEAAPVPLPKITSFSPSSGTVGAEVTITGSNLGGVTVVSFNGANANSHTIDSSTQIRAVVPAGASTGMLTVTDNKGSGNSSDSFEILIGPIISSFSPESGPVSSEVTILGQNFSDATAVAFDGTPTPQYTILSNTKIIAEVPYATSGRIRVQSFTGTGVSRTNFVVIRPPTIVSFSPTSGGRESEVSISGTSLAGVTEVALGGTPVTFTVDSDTQLSFKVPPSAGTGKITLSNAAGSAESQHDFTVIESPIIQAFTPQEGIEGTEVTIAGTHFDTATEVTFAGTPATELTIDSDDQLRAQVPPGASSGKIAVITAGGAIESKDDFEVLAPPVVSSFAPMWGLPGDEVTIHGYSFARVDRVAFGTIEATQFVIDSDQRLRATVPPAAENGKINLLGQYGSAESHEPFQMLEAPAIAAFTPQSGPWGSEVTITGLNFVDIVSVTHNGLSVASFTVDSDSQIRAVVPAISAEGAFQVTNRAGSATSSSNFLITEPQRILTFKPTDDSFVHSGKAGKNYGDGTELRVREASESQYTYLKFKLSGLGGPIVSANLRLYVLEGSDDAGDLHLVSNNYDDGKTPWKETGLDWKNAPAISGKPVKSLGAVKTGKTVNLKVTSVISGNGTYSFGIKNNSSQVAKFYSKEGGKAAELIVEVDLPEVEAPLVPLPKITSFSPNSGTVGDEITIIGSNLGAVTAVSFNGTNAASHTIDSSTQVRVIVPAGASSGVLTVTDSNGSGKSSESFQVLHSPIISSFSPESGPVGSKITILGKHFSDATSVALDGTLTPKYTILSNTKIIVEVPDNATSGKISVQNTTGTALSTDVFSVDNRPFISSLSPASGPVDTEVTITGSNLAEATAVLFNGASATTFESVSDTKLRARVPRDASSGPVSVHAPSGVGVSADEFSVETPTETIVFKPIHDSFVYSKRADNNYGLDDELRARENSSGVRQAYIKFELSGLNAPPSKATLRLRVTDASDDGGSIYLVSNDYKDSSQAWEEENLVWPNAPDIDGNPLAAIGPVSLDETVEIDITSVIEGNGTYCFGIRNSSSDVVKYCSKEGPHGPELVIGEAPPSLAPSIISIVPTQGGADTEVTLVGSNFGDVTSVSLGKTAISNFSVDSESRLRFTVPAEAKSGRIAVATSEDTGRSAKDFLILRSPKISSLAPANGHIGMEVTVQGLGLTGVTDVHFNGTPAQSFKVISDDEIRAVVPSTASTGSVTITNPRGTTTSEDDFTLVDFPDRLTFHPTDDGLVRSSKPTRNYGEYDELRVRQNSEESNVYLKFEVSGWVGAIKSAVIRLHVVDGSDDGGKLYSVSNLHADSDQPWQEASLIWKNAPAIKGSKLDSQGAISRGETVEFDVTAAINGDGIYSFAIRNKSADVASYSSKEGKVAPELLITSDGRQGSLAKSASAELPVQDLVSNPPVEIDGLVPTELDLQGNYPNPFNAATTVEYALPQDGRVYLSVYNLRGQEVKTLVAGEQTAGFKKIVWNGRTSSGNEASSGVYFITLRFQENSLTRMITLQK